MTQTDFDKALEEAASKFANCRNGKFAAVNSEEWIRSFEGHKEGARWAREFTVREVVDIFRSNEANNSPLEAKLALLEIADIIEQYFKDRGGEK